MNTIRLSTDNYLDIKKYSLNTLVSDEMFWRQFKYCPMKDIVDIVNGIKRTKSIKKKMYINNKFIIIVRYHDRRNLQH